MQWKMLSQKLLNTQTNYTQAAQVKTAITGSAVALHRCNGHSKINQKMKISTPCRIATPRNFILKFGMRDYIRDMTRHANFGTDQFGRGFSTKM